MIPSPRVPRSRRKWLDFAGGGSGLVGDGASGLPGAGEEVDGARLVTVILSA
jgi:hypothetical protein